jgi:hypothetical protein
MTVAQDARPGVRVRDVTGESHVVLSASARALAALETTLAEPIERPLRTRRLGRVLPIAELRRAIALVRAREAVLNAHAAVVRTLDSRVDEVTRWSAKGDRTLAREHAALALEASRARAELVVHSTALHSARARLVAQWGAQFAAADSEQALVEHLAQQSMQLVSFHAPRVTGALSIARAAPDARARDARLLGLAATTDGAQPAWLASVDDGELQPGMAVDVWLDAGGETLRGLRVPASALVWYAGTRWFYVEKASAEFVRRAFVPLVADGELVAADAIAPGERLVVRGAQALLAEELRAHIPDEEDD